MTVTWKKLAYRADVLPDLLSPYAVGNLLYADSTTTLAKLAAVAVNNALISGGIGAPPAWGKVGLTTHVSGILPVANGGTGASDGWTAAQDPGHKHSKLWASDGSPEAVTVDDTGNVVVPGTITTNNSFIGITSPGYGVVILNNYSNTNWEGNYFISRRSRGTLASPLIVADGDTIFVLDAYCYDGVTPGTFIRAGNIVNVVSGTPSAGIIPSAWKFSVTNAAGTLTEVIRISPASNVGFSVTAFGTSAVKVLGIGSGTAPSTSPADMVQMWSADRGAVAGKAALHIRTEDGTSHVFGDLVGIGTTSPGALLDVNGNARVSNLGILGTAPVSTYGIYGATSFTDPGTGNSGMNLNLKPTYTASASASFVGNYTQLYPIVNSTFTNSSSMQGNHIAVFRNNNGAAVDDAGTLATMYGAYIQYGHFNTNAATTPQTTSAYGLAIEPYYKTGTITNMYDLYLGVATGGGTATNRWGIYQINTANNYFAGNIGIGTTSPGSKLQVYSATSQSLQDGFAILRLEYGGGYDANSGGALITFAQQYSSALPGSIMRVGGIRGYKSHIDGAGGGGVQLLYQTNSASDMSPGLTLIESGNVGIGTTSPGSILHIEEDNSTAWLSQYTGASVYTPYSHELTIKNGQDNISGSFSGLFLYAGETSAGASINSARIAAIREGLATANTSLAFSVRSGAVMNEAVRITNAGNVGIGASAFGTSAVKVLGMGSGTAPTTFPADMAQMCVKDQAAGNACFHFYTELGQIIKFYQQAHLADLNAAYTAGGLDTEAEIITALNLTNAKINSLLLYLENLGFNATA